MFEIPKKSIIINIKVFNNHYNYEIFPTKVSPSEGGLSATPHLARDYIVLDL